MDTTLSRPPGRQDTDLPLALLLAHSDADVAADISARATAAVDGLAVLHAPDGAEAIRLGLHYGPAMVVIDLGLPIGGLGAAVTLRQLRPQMPLAVHSGDLQQHRQGARRLGVEFFSDDEVERVVEWITMECAVARARRQPARSDPKHAFVCAECGYGVIRAVPPARCPMCRHERWTPEPWRPFSRGLGVSLLPARAGRSRPPSPPAPWTRTA
ncbi:MAG: hypothetical protein ACTHNU_00955 [Gaiellales bacterium]